jgi:hypothetical protein
MGTQGAARLAARHAHLAWPSWPVSGPQSARAPRPQWRAPLRACRPARRAATHRDTHSIIFRGHGLPSATAHALRRTHPPLILEHVMCTSDLAPLAGRVRDGSRNLLLFSLSLVAERQERKVLCSPSGALLGLGSHPGGSHAGQPQSSLGEVVWWMFPSECAQHRHSPHRLRLGLHGLLVHPRHNVLEGVPHHLGFADDRRIQRPVIVVALARGAA